MTRTVVFACDDNYAQYLAVTMASLIENFKSNCLLEIIVFDAGIGSASKNKLNQLKRNNIDIQFFPIDIGIFSNYPLTIKHISIATYFRLKLPSLLPRHRKVVYLDVDVIVNKDISDMWDIELNEHAIGAVQEPYGRVVNNDFHKKIGITDPRHHYFNAGVLIMDLDKLRNINFEDSVVLYLSKYRGVLEYQDQDILNSVLQGDVVYIHPKYNYIPSYRNLLASKRRSIFDALPYNKNEIVALKKNASIYHYCGKKKPWMYGCTHHGSTLYLKYQNLTAWRGVGLSDESGVSMLVKLIDKIYRRFSI